MSPVTASSLRFLEPSYIHCSLLSLLLSLSAHGKLCSRCTPACTPDASTVICVRNMRRLLALGAAAALPVTLLASSKELGACMATAVPAATAPAAAAVTSVPRSLEGGKDWLSSSMQEALEWMRGTIGVPTEPSMQPAAPGRWLCAPQDYDIPPPCVLPAIAVSRSHPFNPLSHPSLQP